MKQHRKQTSGLGRGAAGIGVALGLLGGLGAACSAPSGAEQTAEVAHPISGGSVDLSHQSVFLLVRHQGDSSAFCTATLLAPNLLLTARHCVSPGTDETVLCGDSVLGEPYPASSFFATNDPQPREGSPVFHAREVRVPVQGEDTCGYDIALLILDANVPTGVAEPAVPRIDLEVAPGEPYTAVGYGVDENGQSTGTRMERTGLNVDCQPGSCGSGVESTEFRGEDGICSGDSGGPALDAMGKVVGVVSRGGPDCGTPIYGTVTAWRRFLVDTAQEAADLGSYEPPFWVTTGSSEPPEVPNITGAAGSAGEPGAEAEMGEPCSASRKCGEGLACYQSAPDDDAVCVAQCGSDHDCESGMACQSVGARSVCLATAGGAADSCAMAPAAPARSGAAWLALGLVGLLAARRRAAT